MPILQDFFAKIKCPMSWFDETNVSDDHIRLLAYELWLRESCPSSREKEHWDRASLAHSCINKEELTFFCHACLEVNQYGRKSAALEYACYNCNSSNFLSGNGAEPIFGEPVPARPKVPSVERWKIYLDERKAIDEYLLRVNLSFAQAMVTIPAGAIAITVPILWNIQGVPRRPELLYCGWICVGVTLALMLGSMIASRVQYNLATDNLDGQYKFELVNKPYNPKIVPPWSTWIEIMAMVVLVLGMVAILSFSVLNAPGRLNAKQTVSTIDISRLKQYREDLARRDLLDAIIKEQGMSKEDRPVGKKT